MSFGNHKDLVVWKKSMDLVTTVYKITKSFPASELYGLTSQMRRSAISIPSNIAEGRRRMSTQEFIHYCRIAFGSAAELETQIEIALRLGFTTEASVRPVVSLLEEILKILNKLSSNNIRS